MKINTFLRSILHAQLAIVPILLVLSISIITGCAPKNVVVNGAGNVYSLDRSIAGKLGTELAGLPEKDEKKANTLTHKVLATAYSQMGKPYVYGGNSPETGFDCSGFIQWAYDKHGIDLPRSSRDMMSVGVEVPPDEIQPGDIVVYREYRRGATNHAGIYSGNGVFIHSPHTGSRIKESAAFDAYHLKHFVTARRVLPDNANIEPLPEETKKRIVQAALAANVKPNTTNPSSGKPSAESTMVVYKVKAGDTISKIAHRYGVSTNTVLAANGLRKTSTLRLGQKIKVPAKTSTRVANVDNSEDKKSNAIRSDQKYTSYKIKSGDVISEIAYRHGVSTENVLKANDLSKNTTLKIGQVIKIPRSSSKNVARADSESRKRSE
jgi:LysM repeat protein